jgi:uncharacterized membrane protein YcaP (DUF421 family)
MPIRVPDAHRFLFGEAPPAFLLEAAFRLLVLYVVLVFSIRATGRRTSSELSRNETMAVVALAAAIGPPMQTPDRGLLPPIMIALWVVAWQRVIARATFHSRAAERVLQGQGTTLVRDGVIDTAALKSTAVSRERLVAELRSGGILQLGQVERLYLEADGAFSLIQREEAQPGLSIVPTSDPSLRGEQPEEPGLATCSNCGLVTSFDNFEACSACDNWGHEHAVRMPPWAA